MRRLLITLICVTLSVIVAASSWSIEYNDGGTHIITADATENVNVSNGTTIVVNGSTPKNNQWGYPFKDRTLTLTGGSKLISDPASPYTGEPLGQMYLVLDNSSVSLTHYTSSRGITLSNGSTLTVLNSDNNHYGPLLGNDNGGLKVTSGTNYVKLCGADTNTVGTATFRPSSSYHISVSKDAVLDWSGTIRTHTSNTALQKNGEGTLIVRAGSVGGYYANPATVAGSFNVNAGTLSLVDTATIFEGSTITVAKNATLNLGASASSSTAVLKISGTLGITGGNFTLNAQSTVDAGSVVNVGPGATLTINQLTAEGTGQYSGSTINVTGASGNVATLVTKTVASGVVGADVVMNYGQWNNEVKDGTWQVKNLTLVNSTLTSNDYTTLRHGDDVFDQASNSLTLNNSTINVTNGSAVHANYGAYLFNYGFNVVGGSEGNLATSYITTGGKGIRWRRNGGGSIFVDEFAVLDTDAVYSMDNGAVFRKTGEGTMILRSKNNATAHAGNSQKANVEILGGKLIITQSNAFGDAANFQSGSILVKNATLEMQEAEGLQWAGALTVENGTFVAKKFTTINNKITLKASTITLGEAGPNVSYGNLLFFGGMDVGVGESTIEGTSANPRFHFGGASNLNVAEGGTLISNASISYDNRTTTGSPIAVSNFTKSGAGTLVVNIGTLGGFVGQPWGDGKQGDGKLVISAGTVELAGDAELFGATTVNVASGATMKFNSTKTDKVESVITATGAGAAGQTGAVVFDKSATVDNAIILAGPTTIGVGAGATATLTKGVTTSYALTKDGAGELVMGSAAPSYEGNLLIKNGSIQLNKLGAIQKGTVTVTGENSVLKLNANDALNFGDNATKAVTIRDGGTMSATVSGTHITLTNRVILDGGNVTSTTIGKTDGTSIGTYSGYGNYLITGGFRVTNDGNLPDSVSKIDAFKLQIRNKDTFQIAEGAVLETCSHYNVINDPSYCLGISGGGTFRPYNTEMTYGGTKYDMFFTNTSSMEVRGSTLDLTKVTNATKGGGDWTLFTTKASEIDARGYIVASEQARFILVDESDLKIDVTIVDGKMLGPSIQATDFDIGDDSTLYINVLNGDEFELEDTGTFELFDVDLVEGLFADIQVAGLPDWTVISANGSSLTVGVPEPATWVMMVLALGGLAFLRRKQMVKRA